MVSRREFLLSAAGSFLIPSVLAGKNISKARYYGWVPNKAAVRKFKSSQPKPYFTQYSGSISGSGDGKQSLLWKHLEKVTGKPLKPHFQEIGDCSSSLGSWR
jgi:hypothetical protein